MLASETIWVAHPDSGQKLVNVESFLHHLTTFDSSDTDSPLSAGARSALARTIRQLNLTVHDPMVTDPKELASIYRDLHRLDDALNSINERSY